LLSASFILPTGLEDLTYAVDEYGNILLTTRELEMQDNNCEPGSLGSLSRVYEKDVIFNDQDAPWWNRKDGLDEAVDLRDAVKLGDFYIYRYGPQDTCSADISVTKRLIELKNKIPELLKTAKIWP